MKKRKKYKPKSNKTKLEEKLWGLCKTYIRLRDRDTCQKCEKKVYGRSADTSHIYCKKTYRSLRFDELNLMVKCMACHKWWHNNPLESKDWFKEKFPERYEYLQAEKLIIKNLKEFHLEELIAEYQDKIQDLECGIEITKELK